VALSTGEHKSLLMSGNTPLAAALATLWLWLCCISANAACDGDGGTDHAYLTVNVPTADEDQRLDPHGAVAARCSLPGPFPGLASAGQEGPTASETIPLVVFVESGSLMCSAPDVDMARKAVEAAVARCGPGCQPLLLVGRGDCTFTTKLNHSSYALEGLGPAESAPTVLVIDNQCGPFVSMAVDGLEAHVRPAFCPIQVGEALAAIEGQPRRRVQLATERSTDDDAWARAAACPQGSAGPPGRQCSFQWDGSLAVLLLLATATVAIGSHGSGALMIEKLQARLPPLPGAARQPPPRPDDDTSVVITARMASFYCVFASCGLMFMYLFLESIVMFMVCYVIFVSSCVAAMLTTGWLAPHLSKRRVTFPDAVRKVLCGGGKDVLVSELLIYAICACVGISFFVNRHEPWSWVLQDFLCLHLCIYVIRTFELPNAKVAAILLCALFVYDIFWVYISPYAVALFKSWSECSTPEDLATDPNNSVMVHVARGVPADPASNKLPESIPIVIRMPRWGAGGSSSESMLGLGDIIIPALSTAMLWRFDLAAGRTWSGPLWLAETMLPLPGGAGNNMDVAAAKSYRWLCLTPHPNHFLSGYFIPSLVGYVIALCCAYFVVANWCLAQPALLYIVPLSLWTVLGLAHRRGDLPQLWSVGPDPHWLPPRLTGSGSGSGSGAGGGGVSAGGGGGGGGGSGSVREGGTGEGLLMSDGERQSESEKEVSEV
jgi:signal peptide peptidase-like protein 2B